MPKPQQSTSYDYVTYEATCFFVDLSILLFYSFFSYRFKVTSMYVWSNFRVPFHGRFSYSVTAMWQQWGVHGVQEGDMGRGDSDMQHMCYSLASPLSWEFQACSYILLGMSRLLLPPQPIHLCNTSHCSCCWSI